LSIRQIYGPESSGKTTLALHAMAAMQRAGGTCALIDAEHAFDPVYAASLGLNAREMIMSQPDSGEMALEVVDKLVRSSGMDLIAVDSVAALIPQAEIEGEIGLIQVGAQARLMSQALRKLSANASKANCTIIFLNQLRSKIGVMYGSPEVTSGGNALKFYASVRLDIRKIGQIPDKQSEAQTGIRCKVKVVKNKVAPPYRVAEFDLMFGSGINHLGCVVDAAEATGVIAKRGAWYSYNDANLGQGREKTVAALAENAQLAAEIEAAVRAHGALRLRGACVCCDADAVGSAVARCARLHLRALRCDCGC
jgi:recombination protein RecA